MKPRGKNLKRMQFLAERHYRICLQVVSALLADGLLTEKEAVRVRKRLKKMYDPTSWWVTASRCFLRRLPS